MRQASLPRCLGTRTAVCSKAPASNPRRDFSLLFFFFSWVLGPRVLLGPRRLAFECAGPCYPLLLAPFFRAPTLGVSPPRCTHGTGRQAHTPHKTVLGGSIEVQFSLTLASRSAFLSDYCSRFLRSASSPRNEQPTQNTPPPTQTRTQVHTHYSRLVDWRFHSFRQLIRAQNCTKSHPSPRRDTRRC